jgi:hypothetical protein
MTNDIIDTLKARGWNVTNVMNNRHVWYASIIGHGWVPVSDLLQGKMTEPLVI